jgi:hypothetical protein
MKKCAFCTRPADSREHIFSDWMLKMIPPNERFHFNERVVTTGEYKRYNTRKVKIKAKVVCTTCNNTWMSVLENNHVKPAAKHLLILKTPTILGPKEVVPIAAFAFKTLVMANHKDLNTTPFFPSSQRFKFRRDLSIPDGVQIWMASRHGPAGKYYGFWQSSWGQTDQLSLYGFRIYNCTWNFQNLVLQILAGQWKDKRRRRTEPFPALIPYEGWNDGTILIWPPDGKSFRWPPPLYIGDDALQAFRDRWNRVELKFG